MLTIGAGSISLAQFTDTDRVDVVVHGRDDRHQLEPGGLDRRHPMMPGDTADAGLTISNDGTGDLRYAMSVAATNALGAALQLDGQGRATRGGGCAAFTGASSSPATTLNGAAFGSSTQGAQAGDRNLAARRERGPVLPGQPAADDRQRAPGRDLRRDVHVRRRADRQQPVTLAFAGCTAGCGSSHGRVARSAPLPGPDVRPRGRRSAAP